MQRIRSCIIVVGIVGTVAGVLLAIVAFATGEWRFFYDAKVAQFYTCGGRDPTTGLPMKPVTAFPMGAEQIYACGYLETSSWVRLGFVVFSDGHFVRTIYDKKFDQGYFVEPVCPSSPCTLTPGFYRIDIERARNVLGSTWFTVTEEKP